jgi:hypothetical protein
MDRENDMLHLDSSVVVQLYSKGGNTYVKENYEFAMEELCKRK